MKQKRSDQLREAIEEKIAIGEYAPGKRLDEAELLAEFGVSRTPLREALIQLASLGLIELRPRRGAVVAEISPQQLIEMFEVMGELEAMCSRLAARRITDAEQKELLAAHQACRAAAASDGPDTVAAILAGKGDVAAERIRKHVLIQGERFGDLVASLEVLAA